MDDDDFFGQRVELLHAHFAHHGRSLRPAAFVFDQARPDAPTLVMKGSIVGSALHALSTAMERILRNHDRQFVVDVSSVDQWSLVAQAMVLATARRKAARGERLVLRGAGASLREHSVQLGLFDRVATVEAGSATRPGGTGVPPPAGRLT